MLTRSRFMRSFPCGRYERDASRCASRGRAVPCAVRYNGRNNSAISLRRLCGHGRAGVLMPGLGAPGLGVSLYVLSWHRIPGIGGIEARLYRAAKPRFMRRSPLRADRITMMSRGCRAPNHLLV